MVTFTYTARDSSGQLRQGTLEAASEAQILARLRASGLVTLELLPVDSSRKQGVASWGSGSIVERLLRPRPVDIEVGLQQIAYMIRSGMPLVVALRTAAEQANRRSVATMWTEVSQRVQSGSSLAAALSQQRSVPEIVVTMVGVGEKTGELADIFVRAAEGMQRRRSLRTQVVTALAYPAIVVVMSVAAVSYMMVGLVPKLGRFLKAMGRRLPPLTQLLIDVSDFAQAHFLNGLIGLTAVILAIIALRAWPTGRLAFDRAALSLPLIGRIFRLSATASFSRHMSILLASGVRVTEALRVVEPVLLNHFVRSCVSSARQRVLQGSTLAAPLSGHRAFQPMLASMSAVGESSGSLDEALTHVADFHDAQLESLLRRLGALIEPILIIILGSIVGFIYLAFFMAIYAIAGGGR